MRTVPVVLSPAVAAQQALASRLRTVAPALLTGGEVLADPAATAPATDAAEVFERLVSSVEKDPADDRIWLLLTALSATYPSRGEVIATRRRIQLDSPMNLRMYLLDNALALVRSAGTVLAEIDLVTDRVIVDVDFTAKNELHTGIQRVSRNLVPVWLSDRQVIPAAWTAEAGMLRRLRARELDRVVNWAQRDKPGLPSGAEPQSEPAPRLIVPWRTVVVLVEVPPPGANDRLAALGSLSGNRLVGISYDSIPIVSADAVPPVESMKFARYLTAVKFASRMAGISEAATAEMQGFVRTLPTQGLTGPIVSQVSLPAGGHPEQATRSAIRSTGVPRVLAVGSHEPRKNHLAILHAAEQLWRDGLRFDLEFIGGSGWGEEFPRLAADLKAAGRPVEVRKGVSDHDLDAALSTALFTVFPSLHEGYGLPVAESMAHGTPVITSDFGSMAEIAADGGALLIDPRDDVALTEAMRLLLTDASEVQRLREEIQKRPARGWTDYADELWSAIVAPELRVLAHSSAASTTAPSTERP